MRLSMAVVLGILSISGTAYAQDLETKELHKEGAFTVRKWVKEGVCKLEISLMKGNQPVGILGLLEGKKYYDELFTSRNGIGKVKDKITVRFDREPPLTVHFQPGSEAQNDNWHWQYLKSSEELLTQVRRRTTMKLSFSNGKETFDFNVPLQGSLKAVAALKQCSGTDKSIVPAAAAGAAGAAAAGTAAVASSSGGEKTKPEGSVGETKGAQKRVVADKSDDDAPKGIVKNKRHSGKSVDKSKSRHKKRPHKDNKSKRHSE
ncbi:MAG: hypothetical protein HQL60_08730 [Magnetococcales bacterium]|nr:hypothetical protein [Magnetococcales bacterium]